MAAAISPAIISSRCTQPTLFHSKLFLRSSSVVHGLSLSAGSSVLHSHAIKVVAPRWGTNQLKPIQCKVKPPARGRHFRIIMDKPGGESTTKLQIYEYYIQILANAVGSKEEAKKCICSISYDRPYGFECEIDEETSRRLKDLPGVQVLRM
ncbi:multiple organellar RNA editing factor 5, chloroplastic/mitochondrial-like [Macadamia integrifolia]|uniref:multiple organellar RNA editing factor 5, chloroplastic/mitochondrial-like n=1 Tax=Macadamia integrifolia TaxID=60698 RepID=UPI001C4F9724|nr:multiple organellar RNA editing factor 5, chloroplastic/mitochondrial-like [Macadamia integrifolia]XP_042482875.1 multiple organellar RNA editing factor 5, chloroplastic/mitochondrial-like [Macadamia integrifolia]